jgi:hypothetical protein
MNWKIFVAQHWRGILIGLQIGLVVLAIVAVAKVYAPDAIDSPCGP